MDIDSQVLKLPLNCFTAFALFYSAKEYVKHLKIAEFLFLIFFDPFAFWRLLL